jgi:hypothetical protein
VAGRSSTRSGALPAAGRQLNGTVPMALEQLLQPAIIALMADEMLRALGSSLTSDRSGRLPASREAAAESAVMRLERASERQ